MFCIQCGQELNSESEFCFKCGAKAATPTDESGSFCIQCGKKLPKDSAFCTDCGAKVTAADESGKSAHSDNEESFCTKCGQQLPSESEFCTACGEKVDVKAEPAKPPVEPVKAASPTPPASTPQDVAEMYTIMDHSTIEATPPPAAPKENATETVSHADITWDAPPEPLPIQAKKRPPKANTATAGQGQKAKGRNLTKVFIGVSALLLVVIVGLVVFIILGRDGDNGRGQQNGTRLTIDDFDYEEDYYVYRVTNGRLPEHPDVAIGAAIDNFFVNPYWTYFTDGTSDYVSVHGYIIHEGESAMGQFFFQFYNDGASFRPINLIIDGAWQDVMLMHEMLDTIMLTAPR